MRDYSGMTSWTHVDFLLSFASPKPSICKRMLEFNLMNELSCSIKLFPRFARQTAFVHFVDPSSSTVIHGSAVWFQISPFVRGSDLSGFMALRDLLHVSWNSSALQDHSQYTTLYHTSVYLYKLFPLPWRPFLFFSQGNLTYSSFF